MAVGKCAAQDPEEVMAYLDGELSAERAAAVYAHVSGCEACQRISEELQSVSYQSARWDVGDPPSTLSAPMRAIEPSGPVRRFGLVWRPSVLAPVSGLAAVAILVTFVAVRSRPAHSVAVEDRMAVPRPVPLPRSTSARQTRGFLESPPVSTPAGLAAATEVPRDVDQMQLTPAQPNGVRGTAAAPVPPPPKGPMIARTASLRIFTKDFNAVRPAIDRILHDVGGFAGHMTTAGTRGSSASFTATLRVPADRLDAALAALRGLGQVVQESQGGDDVTGQVVDLDARLTNARNTEKRLVDVLQHRTGKVGDVLEVEREIARVREEVERMDAERTNLGRRVAHATITLEVLEERKAELDLGPVSVPAQLRNAIVDGFRGAFESVLAVALFTARIAPVVLLWGAVLGWPAWRVLRRRRQFANS